MADEDHVDRFILMHGELPEQLAWAPDRPLSLTPEGWSEAYAAYERLKHAQAAVEEEAKRVYDAHEAGHIAGDYDSMDDVVRDTVHLARIFEDGTIHRFGEAPEGIDLPVVPAGATPDRVMKVAQIYGDFGLEVPALDATPGLAG